MPHAQALIERADALNDRGAYEEGLRVADQALALAGADATAWTARGWSLENLGRLPEAEDAYRAALRFDPQSPWASVGLATVLEKSGRTDEAGRIYRSIADRGVSRQERDTDLLEIVGWSAFKAGRAAEAEALFRRCLEIEPRRTAVHFDLALTLLAAGRAQEALGQYRVGLDEPDDADALRAHVEVALDDLTQASAALAETDARTAADVLSAFLESPNGDR
jgi:tetratricopeptide (TPR) repeat protein